MDIVRNMEAVFIITLGLACSASYVIDTGPDNRARAESSAATAATAPPAAMHVVVVSARRMTAAEKQQSLEDEKLASIRAASGSHI
jgi:hypothetical protein